MFNLLISLVLAMLAACNAPPQPANKDAPTPPTASKTSTGSSKAIFIGKPSAGEKQVVRVVDAEGDEADHVINLSELAELEGLGEEVNAAIQKALMSVKQAAGDNPDLAPLLALARVGGEPQIARMRLMNNVDIEYEDNAAFLGVSTEPVNSQTAAQLSITQGTGLVLTTVEPESPAAAAGLQQFDVLARLNDQMLVNAPQMAVLVRANKPGDSIKLTYIRGGKETTTNVKLAARRLPKLGPGGARADGGFDAATGALEVQGLPLTGWRRRDTGNSLFDRGAWAAQATAHGLNHGAVEEDSDLSTTSLVYNSDEVNITVETEEGETHVTVKDLKSDETVFDEDRVPNKEELAAMRPEIRKDVERLLADMRNGRIKSRVRHAPMAPVAPTPPVPPSPPSPPSAPTPEASVENESPVM